MAKRRALTERQRQRITLNQVLDYNENQLVLMQKKDWKDLTLEEISLLERFIATGLGTMRTCPPSYVITAAKNIKVVQKEGCSIDESIQYPPGMVTDEDPVAEDVKP